MESKQVQESYRRPQLSMEELCPWVSRKIGVMPRSSLEVQALTCKVRGQQTVLASAPPLHVKWTIKPLTGTSLTEGKDIR